MTRLAVPERVAAATTWIAVFTSGAVLLGLEIAASRVVAPFFGSSLYVWGALIGVVLSGLAIGYWAGGALADRFPADRVLVSCMGLGALAVLAVPIVDGAVLRWVVDWDPGPRLDPLVAAIVLFGPASVLLAAVTPAAVRLRASSLEHLGRTAGRLFAVSTAGSIAGTFATAFFLVPEFGTDQLLAVAAGVLLVAVGVLAAGHRLPLTAGVAAGVGVLTLAFSGSLAPEQGRTLSADALRNYSPVYRLQGADDRRSTAPVEPNLELVHEQQSSYHRILVVDDEEGERFLRFDNLTQSGIDRRDPYRTIFRYTDLFDLGLAYRPQARDVLFIGLGAGVGPRRLWRDFPDVRVRVAELDPAVVDVARRYFQLPRDNRLAVDVDDGRRFLTRHDDRYDVIAIDAYYADSIPFHLTTHEFLQLAASRLRPGGVILANVIGAVEGPDSKLFRSIYRTYRSVLPTVAVHPVIEPGEGSRLDDTRNIMLVATEGAEPSEDFLVQRWHELRRRSPRAPALDAAIRDRVDRQIDTSDVPTLTDDYAPTDALLVLD